MSRCRYCEVTAWSKQMCSKHYYRAYRHPSGEDELWSKITKTADCWLWSGPTRRGFARVSIFDPLTGDVTRHWAAFWIYEKLNGGIGDLGLLVKCGNRSCVNPAHMQQRRRRAGAAMSRMR